MGKLTFYCSVSLKSKETLLHFCNFCFTNISLTISHYINILCLHEKQNEKTQTNSNIIDGQYRLLLSTRFIKKGNQYLILVVCNLLIISLAQYTNLTNEIKVGFHIIYFLSIWKRGSEPPNVVKAKHRS